MGRSRFAIARLLLLAFLIQMAAPLSAREPVAFAGGRMAVCTGDGVHYVYADGTKAEQPSTPKVQAKSCAYCLPIFSGSLTAAATASLVAGPRPRLAAVIPPSRSRRAEDLHYASSHPRAPPAGALTV